VQAPAGRTPTRLAGREAAIRPLASAEIDELESLLAGVPAPLDPLDVGVLDGYLCGVLVQPAAIEPARWLRHVTDVEGRPLPAAFDATRLHALVWRRHAQLAQAIAGRRWFDPWVFDLAPEDERSAASRTSAAPTPSAALDAAAAPPPIEAVYPWVAGFATALELFPALMECPTEELVEPLALLYRHLDADDLEDADALLEEIELLEPVADLEEAVEGLVRATLLLADAAQSAPARPGRT
jgi:uncharacterized protein